MLETKQVWGYILCFMACTRAPLFYILWPSMQPEETAQFRSSLGLMLTPRQVVDGIVKFMRADDTYRYKVIIGSDSEKTAEDEADFVTAVVCHRLGNGGIYFWRAMKGGNCRILRNRIWQEVLMSIDIAKEIVELMKDAAAPVFDFEVHIDVGEKGPTRELIQELVGVVRANNFEARVKPHSYAASKIADRHVK